MAAQRVLYSPIIEGRSAEHFTVAGKVGNQYWVQTEKRKRRIPQRAEAWMKEEQSFEIYDARLQLVNVVPAATITASTLKKWLVCGNRFFDELVLQSNLQQTVLRLRRYGADGALLADSALADFPFAEPGNSFILVASEDKSKYLLLGFESVPASAPRLHAMIFSDQWKQISSLVFEHPFITQPFIQDDFFCFPSSLNNAPVQLANNGQWLMAAPSRTNNNFLLLHFDGRTNNVSYKEIILPPTYKMEDLALSVNNEKAEAIAGILSSYRQGARKNVHVTHYSFAGDAFDFDSAYRFSTLPGNQLRNNTLVKESFVLAVPDLGFMLLKEYGRPCTNWYGHDNYLREPDIVLASNTSTITPDHFSINPNGYTRYSSGSIVRDNYGRGDLNMFYFPGRPGDSCWNGFINKKQITELNAPALSYLFVPQQDKLIFLYNSVERDDDPFGCTTVLDPQGNLITDREMISWKADQSLQMQQSLQITSNEMAMVFL